MIKTISLYRFGNHGQWHGGEPSESRLRPYRLESQRSKMRTVRQERSARAGTPADAVRDVDLVMYSLSNDQAVEEVVFGAKGILSGIKEGQIAMDMSTVLPATSLREQEAYIKHGVDFLDALRSLVANKNRQTPSFGLWPRATRPSLKK